MQALLAVLERAQAVGLIGPGPVEGQVDHAHAFAEVLAGPPGPSLDLGAGGGLPGLVLATMWPASPWTLLDARARAAAFLRWAIDELGLDNVVIAHERAEVLGRDPALRGGFRLVTARGFGPPAVTAECASPFLQVGGRLLVSEPPAGPQPPRWDEQALARLGLAPGERRQADRATVQTFVQVAPCPARFPRRSGIPAKRPLF